MRGWLAGVKRWWLRRFRGVVAPPAGQSGTTWQQHPANAVGFQCNGRLAGGEPCGLVQAFGPENYVIREQEHREDCPAQYITPLGFRELKSAGSDIAKCSCPVTDARYIRICSACGLGHWRQA